MRTATPWGLWPPWCSRLSWAFQGVVDRFDDLAKRAELRCAAADRLVAACRADEFDAVFGESTLELGGCVALVGDDRLAVAAGEQGGFGFEQVDGDVTFVELSGWPRRR